MSRIAFLILGMALFVGAAQKPYAGMPCNSAADCQSSTTLMSCTGVGGGFSCGCEAFRAAAKFAVTQPAFDTSENKCVIKKGDICKVKLEGHVKVGCQASTRCELKAEETEVGTCQSGASILLASAILPVALFSIISQYLLMK